MKLQLIFISLNFFLIAPTCNKEIQLPNPELKKIFGRWEWIETSGGFAGKIVTPEETGIAYAIEFSVNGIFQYYKDEKLIDKKRFSINEGKSIYGGEKAYIIAYSNLDSLFRGAMPNQSVSFSGSDTLLLKEECYDCFSTVFVRKK